MMTGGIFATDEKMQGGEMQAIIQFASENDLGLEKSGMMHAAITAGYGNDCGGV